MVHALHHPVGRRRSARLSLLALAALALAAGPVSAADAPRVGDAAPGFRLQDQAGFTRTQTEPVDRVVLYLWALLGLAVLLGVAGIANTLVLSVHERRRELGLLRAAGMTGRQLREAVRIEALLLAALGAAFGLALGTASAAAVVGALHDQGLTALAVPWAQLVVMVVVTAVAAVGAAAWPARRAARVDVLAALEPD